MWMWRTYKIANFLGLSASMGMIVKHTTKRAMAAIFRPPKTRMRSHLLTADTRLAGHAFALNLGERDGAGRQRVCKPHAQLIHYAGTLRWSQCLGGVSRRMPCMSRMSRMSSRHGWATRGWVKGVWMVITLGCSGNNVTHMQTSLPLLLVSSAQGVGHLVLRLHVWAT